MGNRYKHTTIVCTSAATSQSRARVNKNTAGRAESHGDGTSGTREEKRKRGDRGRDWTRAAVRVRSALVVDGVQVREQYISVTRRRVIKGGVAGGSG